MISTLSENSYFSLSSTIVIYVLIDTLNVTNMASNSSEIFPSQNYMQRKH